MKTLLSSALVATCIFCTQLQASSVSKPINGKSSKSPAKKEMHRNCLALSGSVTMEGKKLKDVTVLLYKGDKLIHTTPEGKKEVNTFVLQENAYYTVRYTKPGFADRMICIDTHLPEGVEMKPIFEFDFNLVMISDQEVISNPSLDFPAGLIYYDLQSEKFEASDPYSTSLKNLTGKTGAVVQK
ncbi:MAG: hypothetical protein ACHQRM_12015 [Bacteroidia bacterium]